MATLRATKAELQLANIAGKLRDLSAEPELTEDESRSVRQAMFLLNRILRARDDKKG